MDNNMLGFPSLSYLADITKSVYPLSPELQKTVQLLNSPKIQKMIQLANSPEVQQAVKLAAQIDPLPWADFDCLHGAWENIIGADYSWIHDYGSMIADLPQVVSFDNHSRIESWSHNALLWADCGWVLILNAPIVYLDKAPASVAEADKEAMSHLNDDRIQQMCDEIFNHQVQISELKEAICCYENHNYRACALLMFSIIDRQLAEFNLRNKPKDLYEQLKKRNITKPVGSTAVRGVKEKIESLDDFQLVFGRINWECMFRVLNLFFDNGKDFKIVPPTINRNFLMHGFYDRELGNIDCIKLILLLHTFLENLSHVSLAT